MNLLTEFSLARRYLRPKRNAISVITLISLVGVILGVMVLIVVLSIMTGLSDAIKERLLKTSPHLQISPPPGQIIENPDQVIAVLKKHHGAGAAVVTRPVIVQSRDRLLPRLAIGANYPQIDGRIQINWQLNDFGTASPAKPMTPGTIIVGHGTARDIFATFGDTVLLHSPSQLMKLVEVSAEDGTITTAGEREINIPAELKVNGFFSTNSREFDDNTVFINLEDANDLFDMRWGTADTVYGWLPDPFDMDRELAQIRAELKDYNVQSWMQIHQKVLGVLQVEKTMMFFLLIFIVLVAAFSITNTLVTVVHQKTREIGLLNSLGATPFSIMRIFIMQGLLVGLIGGALGIAAGILTVYWRNDLIRLFGRLTGREIMPDNVYIITELPARLVASDIITVGLIAVGLCTLGALLPALRAARLDPARALRYE